MSVVTLLNEKGYVCEDIEVVKNGVVLNGITIKEPDNNIGITVYEDAYIGLGDEEAADLILRAYHYNKVTGFKLPSKEEFLSHSYIGVQKHRDDKNIYKPFLDMCAFVYVTVIIGDNTGEIKVNESILNHYGLDFDSLYNMALTNTLLATTIEDMGEVLKEFGLGDIPCEGPQMMVLTNRRKSKGAGAIVCKEIFRGICLEKGITKLLIIPSSIHEIIVLNYEDCGDKAVNEIITRTNAGYVDEQDLLSDHAYIYDLETDSIQGR